MVAALVIVCVFAIKGVIDKRAERKRQVEYQSMLNEYTIALKSGMTRHDVESYLKARNRGFRRMCCVGLRRTAYADLVRIGKEQAPWYCSENNVYVAFEFETTEPHGIIADSRDSDRLVSMALFPWLEQCL